MKKIKIFLALLGVGFIFYLFSTQILRFSISVNETFITNSTIPNTFDGARIIQFSDLLIENKRDLRVLKNAVDSINRLNPEIVVFTGNLFKEGVNPNNFNDEVIELLTQIDASLGKIAILGQFDLMNSEAMTQLLTNASFNVLRNNSIELFNGAFEGITFIGIDSLVSNPNINSFLSMYSHSDKFDILLISEPSLASMTLNHPVELQLSGYCRGVSLSIDTVDNRYCKQFSNGTYHFANQLLLNVNRGLNRPKHPFTFLNRPTIDSFLLMTQ